MSKSVFIIGAVLMVLGAAATLFRQEWAPWVFVPGAVAFAVTQMRQPYDDSDFTKRRLHRILVFSDILILLSAALMVISSMPSHTLIGFLGLDWLTYLNYIHNNWVVTLLLAAILQLYTSFRS